jgi:hypothetical protein
VIVASLHYFLTRGLPALILIIVFFYLFNYWYEH